MMTDDRRPTMMMTPLGKQAKNDTGISATNPTSSHSLTHQQTALPPCHAMPHGHGESPAVRGQGGQTQAQASGKLPDLTKPTITSTQSNPTQSVSESISESVSQSVSWQHVTCRWFCAVEANQPAAAVGWEQGQTGPDYQDQRGLMNDNRRNWPRGWLPRCLSQTSVAVG
jgi:hypothetical protein